MNLSPETTVQAERCRTDELQPLDETAPGSPAELRYTLHDNRREVGQPGDHLMATAEFPADGRLIVASKVCHGPTPLRITGPSAMGG
jgi:hypothetical protein